MQRTKVCWNAQMGFCFEEFPFLSLLTLAGRGVFGTTGACALNTAYLQAFWQRT